MSFASLEEAEDHYNERIDDLNHEIAVVEEALRVLGVAAGACDGCGVRCFFRAAR